MYRRTISNLKGLYKQGFIMINRGNKALYDRNEESKTATSKERQELLMCSIFPRDALVLLSTLLFTNPAPFPQASAPFPGGSGDDSPCRLLGVGWCLTETQLLQAVPGHPSLPWLLRTQAGSGWGCLLFFIILCHDKFNERRAGPLQTCWLRNHILNKIPRWFACTFLQFEKYCVKVF